MPKSTRPVPRPLALATDRFEKWRKRGPARRKIPERLWDLARGLAETYGVNKTARALRLDYYDLKGRVEALGRGAAPPPETAATFVEVLPRQGGECVVEIEDRRGGKRRSGSRARSTLWRSRSRFLGGVDDPGNTSHEDPRRLGARRFQKGHRRSGEALPHGAAVGSIFRRDLSLP